MASRAINTYWTKQFTKQPGCQPDEVKMINKGSIKNKRISLKLTWCSNYIIVFINSIWLVPRHPETDFLFQFFVVVVVADCSLLSDWCIFEICNVYKIINCLSTVTNMNNKNNILITSTLILWTILLSLLWLLLFRNKCGCESELVERTFLD